MASQFAIYGVQEDAHILRVSRHLQALGIDVVLVDPERDRQCSLIIDAGGTRTVMVGIDPVSGVAHRLGEDYVWWLRNKKRYTHFRDKAEQQSQFVISETTATVVADVKLNERRTYNDYRTVKWHESKPYQLSLARKVGLRTPDTIVSNSKAEMVAFAERSTSSAFAMKAVENVFIAPHMENPDDSVFLYTTLVTVDELRDADEASLAGPPIILQAYVEKTEEVRLMMFDGEAVAYRIDSQSSAEGKIDQRLADGDVISERTAVPEPVRQLCDAYLRRAGLNYGAFDFCIDRHDTWIFLECNAEGQWAWLEGSENDVSRMYARQFHTLISR